MHPLAFGINFLPHSVNRILIILFPTLINRILLALLPHNRRRTWTSTLLNKVTVIHANYIEKTAYSVSKVI